jgi:hypothetical protein
MTQVFIELTDEQKTEVAQLAEQYRQQVEQPIMSDKMMDTLFLLAIRYLATIEWDEDVNEEAKWLQVRLRIPSPFPIGES